MTEEKTKFVSEEDIKSLTQANSHLAVRLHRLLAEEKQNVFFSPFSISTAVAMLLCAAEGETESELRSVLGYEHDDKKREDIVSIFKQQMSLLLKNPDSYTLSCANSILSQKRFDVKDGYKRILTESFSALLLEVNFQKEKKKAINQINEWVKGKTNKMIPKLVHSLDPSAAMVVLNAVYFKGMWMERFLEQETFLQKFYNKGIESNSKEIHMMHMKASFPFYEDHSLQALQLPYVGEKVAMLILLPHAKNGLEQLEVSLSPSFIEDLKKKLRISIVKIALPRFKQEYTISLVPYLRQLGIGRVFSQKAELGIASDCPDLAVSDILHKAVLEMNEEGSEAEACTMAEFVDCCLPLTPEFVHEFEADHPFAFVVYDTRSDLILFMGRVYEL